MSGCVKVVFRCNSSLSLTAAVQFGTVVNSDYHPVLDLDAERTRFRKIAATGFMDCSGDRFDLFAALEERRIGFGTETQEGLILPRSSLRALGARLRVNEPPPASDSLARDREFRQALMRRELLRDALAAPHAPTDWFTWFRMALEVERDLHAGTSGVIDSAFYGDVERYLTRWKAPDAAHSAWRFMKAAGTYNWPGVTAEMTPQLKARVSKHTWIPIDILRTAGVLAFVKTGDRVTARKTFDALDPYSLWDKDDLRAQTLRALVARRKAKEPTP